MNSIQTVEAGFEPATYEKTGSQDQRNTRLCYSTNRNRVIIRNHMITRKSQNHIPYFTSESEAGFEPAIQGLQPSALPLCYSDIERTGARPRI